MLQNFIDEKEKIRLFNERERREDEEKNKRRVREFDSREKNLEKR
jgi:hypothetical protein